MDKSNLFTSMTDTLTEVTEERRDHRSSRTLQTPPTPDLPRLRTILADINAFPREALFLGLAEDGLPILLNLYDPIPGPILITGDQACGKTSLLQMIACAAEITHAPADLQYGVITPRPEEWIQFQANAKIYSTNDEATYELLQSLVTWAHNNKSDQQSILLLIDGLEETIKLKDQAAQNLRWLLLRGPSRRVWPIVVLNANRAKNLTEWMGFFRTRLFGFTQDPDDSQSLTGRADMPLDNLIAGSQFAMREGNILLKFWSPAID